MRHAWIIVVAAIASACGGNPAAPDGIPSLPEWSPYVGIHAFGPDASVQQAYLLKLMERRAIRGVRMDLDNSFTEQFAQWVIANGGDVLAVFPNTHLREPDVWDTLKSQMSRNPDVRYWELGNELDVFTDIPVSEYIPIFLSLQARAHEEFPDRVLIPQAPCGGCEGAQIIKEMLDAGLLRLAQRGHMPVMAVHYYSLQSAYATDLKKQIGRLPRSTQVWVTETGINVKSRHLEHVRVEYPRMRSLVRAVRLYWYVFAECSQRTKDFSLVSGLPEPCTTDPPELSELYLQLIGGLP